MVTYKTSKAAVILLVEDNPADVRLTQEALLDGKLVTEMMVAEHGEEALAMLRREPPHQDAPRPDLVLLDLNMPRMDGRELLRIIKEDPALRSIPAVVLTTSKAEEDIARSYDLHANCFITKPVDLDQFIHIVHHIEEFWFTIVRLPGADG